MTWFNLFHPSPTQTAQRLARIPHDRHRRDVRKQVDLMREHLGLPPVRWPRMR